MGGHALWRRQGWSMSTSVGPATLRAIECPQLFDCIGGLMWLDMLACGHLVVGPPRRGGIGFSQHNVSHRQYVSPWPSQLQCSDRPSI